MNIASKYIHSFPEATKHSLDIIASQIGSTLIKIQSDQALKLSQRNLRTLFKSLDDFLFVLDSSGKIIDFNPVVEKQLGYSKLYRGFSS
jgi:two-component system, cell cycle sensor histidine kinase and response regulator CckA